MAMFTFSPRLVRAPKDPSLLDSDAAERASLRDSHGTVIAMAPIWDGMSQHWRWGVRFVLQQLHHKGKPLASVDGNLAKLTN